MLTVIVYDRMRKPPVDPLSLLLEDDNPIVQEWFDTIDQKPYEDTWSKSGLAIEVLFSLENVRGSGIRAPNAIRFQSGQPPLVFYLQKSTESSPRRSRARNYHHVGAAPPGRQAACSTRLSPRGGTYSSSLAPRQAACSTRLSPRETAKVNRKHG